jgi:signal transduction histidine kinase/CheY-like chemotaxis protein
LTTALDAVGVVAAVTAFVLVLYLPRCGGQGVLTTALLVAYPSMTLGAAVMAIAIGLESQIRLTWPLLLFLAALLTNGAIWMEWNSRTLDGTLADAAGLNYVFSVAAIAQGVGVALWSVEAHPNAAYQRVCFTASRLLPLMLVIGAAAAIVLGQRIPDVAQVAVMACVAIVVVAAVARQSLLLRDRERALLAEARARELEARLGQSQKLESLGTLAGGIAHDFNNILMAAYGHAQILEASVAQDEPARRSIDSLLRACERGRDLVRRILTFSRRDSIERGPVDVRDVVEESLTFLRAMLPASLRVVFEPPRAEFFVEADAGQLQRVVMNLATNASDALAGRAGTLRITLGATLNPAGTRPGSKPGRYVELVVADDGPGMDAATLRRAFEPLFTTKGPDRGTGLGLSVVHGIVTAHGGTIEVDSAPGRGTRFRICLPAIDAPASRSSSVGARDAALRAGESGREVLVVDDEPLVTPVLAHHFERLGWIVTVIDAPARALELVQREPHRFALAVTDRSMPGMTGDELARRIRLVSDVPILLSTGHAGSACDSALFSGVLHKPFDFAELAAAVERVVAAAA